MTWALLALAVILWGAGLYGVTRDIHRLLHPDDLALLDSDRDLSESA